MLPAIKKLGAPFFLDNTNIGVIMSNSCETIISTDETSTKTSVELDRMKIPQKDNEEICRRAIADLKSGVPDYMILRDIPHNGIDAIIASIQTGNTPERKVIMIDPFYDVDKGTVAFYDTGCGITEDVVRNNFNSLYNSGKLNNTGDGFSSNTYDECKGVGAKITTYNVAKMEYRSRNTEGKNISFTFMQNEIDGHAGLKVFEGLDEEGEEIEDSILSIDDKDFNYLKSAETGTETYLTGYNVNLSQHLTISIQNMFKGRENSKPDWEGQYGWTYVRYINNRYYEFPEDIKVQVKVGFDTHGKSRIETALGAKHHLSKKSILSNEKIYSVNMEGTDIKFKLHYYIMGEKTNNYHAMYFPFFAILHKNEMYGALKDIKRRRADLRKCGLGLASSRVCLLVDFLDTSVSIPSSRKTINMNGKEIDTESIFHAISEDLPQELIDFKNELMDEQDVQSLMPNGTKNFLKKNYGYIKKSQTSQTSTINVANNPNGNNLSSPLKVKSGGNNSGGKPTSNVTQLFNTSTSKSKKGIKRTTKQNIRNANPPKIVADDNMAEDEWADFNVVQWELTYNPNWKGLETFMSMKSFSEKNESKENLKKRIVALLLNKAIEYIFIVYHQNSKKSDSYIQTLLDSETLLKQAWPGSAEISNVNRSISHKS